MGKDGEKFISHKNVMRSLKRLMEGKRKLKVMNDELESELEKIVKDEIIEHARPEAMKLLLKATKEELGEFFYYYHSKSGVMCAVIDSIKDRLVKEGKLKQRKNDNFGLLFTEEFLKMKTEKE